MSLTSHSKWQYSNKLWYKKYHSCIELGPYPRYDLVNFQSDVDFKLRQRYTRNGVIVTIYTSDPDLIEKIIAAYPKVKTIKTPINDKHIDILVDSTSEVEIREKHYHNKYRIKVHTYKSFRNKYTIEEWAAKVAEVNIWIRSNVSDARTLTPSAYGYNMWSGYVPARSSAVDFFYTNSEEVLMLYKLTFSSDFDIYTTYAYTPEDFLSL